MTAKLTVVETKYKDRKFISSLSQMREIHPRMQLWVKSQYLQQMILSVTITELNFGGTSHPIHV